jgi:hypothetical protein
VFRFWDPVVEPLLTAASPAVIVEVGAQGGRNTMRLLDFGRRNACVVHVIDPAPDFDVADLERRYGEHFVPHVARSLEVLGEIAAPDAVLIDGDHNWYTVSQELRLLAERCERDGREFPLTLLHDIAWPYGRRDLYYDPLDIPATHRQPYELAGLVPDRSAPVSDGGFNEHLHNADHEGGPRNGVLTAIEDVLPELPGLVEFVSVPGGHGLAILVPEARMDKSQPLRARFERLQSADFLREHAEWLEAERISGLVRIKELDDSLADARARHAELQDEHASAMDALAGQAGHLGEAVAVQRRFAEQLARQSEEVAAADALRREVTMKAETLEREVLARDEQLTASAQCAQELEDAREEAAHAQEAAERELLKTRAELRQASDAREAVAADLRRHEETLADETRRAQGLQGRIAELRREMLESEARWGDERAGLEGRLTASEETRDRELGSLQRELDSARRSHEWAVGDAAVANRQLAPLRDREQHLAQYAKQLEAQVYEGDQHVQEAHQRLTSAQTRHRAREDETASEVERLGRLIDQLRLELGRSERDSQLAGRRARTEDGELRDQVARAQAQAALSQQTLHTVKQEVERAHESRSWRFGHGMMQALRFLSFRRSRGTDALEKASGRISAALSLGAPEELAARPPALEEGTRIALPPGEVLVSSNGAPSDGLEDRAPRA